MERETTCRCAACASIGSLDLKFVAHYGTYVIESADDREDLAGPDVILVHRLLKNTVGEGGGPQAYAFLTEPCLQRLPQSFDLPSHSESYESFGQMTGGVHDLNPVIARMREARRVYIDSEEADMEVSFGEHPYPPAVLWQYFVDPEKRLRWQPLQTAIENQPNQQGRLGAGASSHCAHGLGGDALREYLDWRPYSYFTNRFTPLGRGPHFFPGIETFEFIPTDTGTRVDYRFRLEDCGPLTRLRVPDPPARRSQGAEPVTESAQEGPRRGRRHRTVAGPLPACKASAAAPLLGRSQRTKSSIARPIGWSAVLVNRLGDHGLWLPPLEVPLAA